MGACTFDVIGVGNTVDEAFVNANRQEDKSEGYSGTILEKDGYELLEVPAGEDVETFVERKTLENPKWGAAYCIFVEKDGTGSVYRFFGWASS